MCRRMGCLGRVKSSAGARLRGSSEHSVNGHGAMGLPGAGARDTLAFSSLAPRQPQAPRRGTFGSERLLLALGTWGEKETSAIYYLRDGGGRSRRGRGEASPPQARIFLQLPTQIPLPREMQGAGQAASRGRRAGGKTWGSCSPSKTTALQCLSGGGVEGQPGGTRSLKTQPAVPVGTS